MLAVEVMAVAVELIDVDGVVVVADGDVAAIFVVAVDV